MAEHSKSLPEIRPPQARPDVKRARTGRRFDEVPGEAEADVVRDAYLNWASAPTRDLGTAIRLADPGTRGRVVLRLQEERGNRFVHRALTEIKSRAFPGKMVGLSQAEMVGEVQSRKGAGSPLAGEVRTEMETFFGTDLGGVRVHTDDTAVQLNRELDAQAFTVGADVFFARGKFNPASRDGHGLLAHELTHVIQQTGHAGTTTQRSEAVQRDEAEDQQTGSAAEPEHQLDTAEAEE